uniref:cubilin-like n=1 Tax=Ciona intestinalis TaxID=7719 RepID=UPI000EF4BD12
MVAAVYPIYFVSPGYPFVYPNNLNCVWTIEAAAGYRIAFTFVSIDIENIDSCNFDFVKIYEGPTVGSTLQGRYCGKQPPSTIYSMDNYLTIQMVTDGSVGYPGFNASYQQACGGFIRGDVGAITSPNYPNNYPPNTFCEWTIVATIGTNISINFDQTFDIRNNDDQLCNNGDYIQLLNGRHGDSPPLAPNHGDGNGKYCGNTAPLDLATLGNGLFVRFSSNSKTAGGGFRLTYSSQEGACGAVLTLTDQFTASSFTSPNYPNGYPTAIDCYWIISAPPTESVQLDFTDFNIQSHPQCDKDYVLVINGHTGNEEILGKFCGTEIPPTVKSTGSDMTVRLRSDEATTLGGFDVVYKIAECGGTLIGVGGVIMSPNYPMDYPNSQSCQWVVRGPAYHFINFEFNALQLNNTEGGCDDYVEFTSYNFS